MSEMDNFQKEPQKRPEFKKRLWQFVSDKKLPRTITSISISFFVHLSLIILYMGMAAFDKPHVAEIHEINFVDMTAIPPEPVVKKQSSQRVHVRESIAIAQPQADLPRPQTTVVSHAIVENNQPAQSKPVSLARRLDMKRTQAPIETTPISLTNNSKSDILKLSQARGTSRDDDIKNKIKNDAAPIQLSKAKDLKHSPIQHQAKPDMSLSTPSINLTKKNQDLTMAPDRSVQDQFSQVESAKSSSVQIKMDQSGVTITGPLSLRKILKRDMPEFPDWAEQQGIGATVALQFTVMESGIVKENIVVVRTSGSAEWDNIVKNALMHWRFVALQTGGRRQDQTGIITFQFKVN